jgi:hypothetical protein
MLAGPLGTIKKDTEMTRQFLIILTLITLTISCQSRQSSNGKSDISSDSLTLDIYGKWYYTTYTDSTIKYKKIYDYSWSIASFAYEITIDKNNPDSVNFRGYHETWRMPLIKISDSVYHAADSDEQYWIIKFVRYEKGYKMQVHEYRDASFKQKADPKVYNLYKLKVTLDNEEKYFAKNILAGKYYDSISNITLILKDNLDLEGLDSLDKYSIQIDPWEMVPQMDIINFYDSNREKYKSYNWKFENDVLILSSIIDLYNDGERIGEDITAETGDYAGLKIDKIVYRFKKQ